MRKFGVVALGLAAVAAGLTLLNPTVVDAGLFKIRLEDLQNLYIASWVWVVGIALLGFTHPKSIWVPSVFPGVYVLRVIVQIVQGPNDRVGQLIVRQLLTSPWFVSFAIITVLLVVISIAAQKAEAEEVARLFEQLEKEEEVKDEKNDDITDDVA